MVKIKVLSYSKFKLKLIITVCLYPTNKKTQYESNWNFRSKYAQHF